MLSLNNSALDFFFFLFHVISATLRFTVYGHLFLKGRGLAKTRMQRHKNLAYEIPSLQVTVFNGVGLRTPVWNSFQAKVVVCFV